MRRLAARLPAVVLSLLPAAAVSAQDFDREVLPFFEKHCFRCHSEKKQGGEFRMDTLSRDVGGGPSVNQWHEVVEKLSSGEMPPETVKERPAAVEAAAVVEWLSARIREGEASRMARRERVSHRRLSREEYAFTVEDLLGVRFDVADPQGLTEDPDWHGFERLGPVLSLSASHVEKYFAAAEAILAEAFPDEPLKPFKIRKDALQLRGGATPAMLADLESRGLLDKVRVDLWPGERIQGGRAGPGSHKLKVGAEYKVRIQVSGLKPPGGRTPRLVLYADKIDRVLFERDIVAPEDAPIVVEFQTHLPGGPVDYRLLNDVAGPSTLPRSGRAGRRPFLSIREGRIPWQLKLTDEEGTPLHPFLIVDWIEWEGPIVSDEARRAREGYLPAGSDQGAVLGALSRFAGRAFRRPLRPGEADAYLRLVEGELAAGATLPAAMKTAFLAVLCSKDFLHVVEGDPTADRGTLDDWELASRMSYFLWSTMPDDVLFALARAGRLRDPAVRRAQVERMLADPKADRFAEAFARQWLQLRRVGGFPPDKQLYPDYDDHLEKSMVRETTAFFGELLRENLPLRELVDSDWTMLNPRLARHYGIEGLGDEDRFRRVVLPPGHRRGGVLTHASTLSLTSDGQRHRPVHRGVWILETLFGTTPPPPPANVDPIEPSPAEAPKATLRAKLEAHRRDPACAACHRKIDPLGLAFENYDALGRWRETERVRGTGADPKVDARGTLADGRSFEDVYGFKALLREDLDRIGETFVRALAMFAMRRTMTVDDRTWLAEVAARGRAADWRVKDVVRAAMLSDLFLRR